MDKKFFLGRKTQMEKMRSEKWTHKMIGDHFNISRQRVQQIIGGDNVWYSKYSKNLHNSKWIEKTKHLTNSQICNLVGCNYGSVSKYRSKIRHKIDASDNSLVGSGNVWEEWAHEFLMSIPIDNELQPYRAPYDILALGNVNIDVKVSVITNHKTNPKLKSPQHSFHLNENHNLADIYFCIVAKSEDVFVIPNSHIKNKYYIAFCWPTLRPEIGKYQKYHNRLDYIYKIHLDKLKTNGREMK